MSHRRLDLTCSMTPLTLDNFQWHDHRICTTYVKNCSLYNTLPSGISAVESRITAAAAMLLFIWHSYIRPGLTDTAVASRRDELDTLC